MSKTKKGVVIAEATGRADNGGADLTNRIELAMAEATNEANRLGIADDCRGERLVELTGDKSWADKVGADYIREAKLAARKRARDQWHAEQAARAASTEA